MATKIARTVKRSADIIHSDNDLAEKLESAVVAGPEAGPSNDELVENSVDMNGGSPTVGGELRPPERQNVSAVRDAIETQAEMEIGKTIDQKQQEIDAVGDGAAEWVADKGPAGSTTIDAKPGKQIIINIASENTPPIGGEDDSKITSGHGGGFFGGTDLSTPPNMEKHSVSFTLNGERYAAEFSSEKAAKAFVKEASVKFGGKVKDWAMGLKDKVTGKPEPQVELHNRSPFGMAGDLRYQIGLEKASKGQCPKCNGMNTKDINDGQYDKLFCNDCGHETWTWWKDPKPVRTAGKHDQPINVGDTVRYAVHFLRSISQYAGPMATAKGTVTGVEEFGRADAAGSSKLVSIDWHGEELPGKVLAANLTVVGSPKERFESMGSQSGEVMKDACDMQGVAKDDKTVEKEAGFNFFFPGQVLREFYPEIQHEIVDYPNATNAPMLTPEIVGDAEELMSALDEALEPGTLSKVENENLMPIAAGFYSTAAPAGGSVSTSPGAVGIGRDAQPQVLDGAPLRKENDIRGPMFLEEFYDQYAGVPGEALMVASVKTASADEAKQFSFFLKKVSGEIAATMIAAFKVTTRPLLDKVPGMGEVQLADVEKPEGLAAFATVNTASRVKYLMDKLTDSEIQDAINDAWAQAAVWHDGPNGGFVYEVFVRMESIDTDSMIAKYKFVAGTRE
jgi:hypothetical protein